MPVNMVSKKYFRKTSQPTSFRKNIFENPTKQYALASYVTKNERVMLAHEASRGIVLTLVAK